MIMDTKKSSEKITVCLADLNFAFLLLLQITLIIKITSVGANADEVSFTDTLGPEFISPVQNQTAAIGREAIFTCSVSNIGKYKVGWLRASDKMIISVHTRTVIQNERFSVKYEPINRTKTYEAKKANLIHYGFNDIINGTWRLMIRQLKESDKGCYMCQINTSPMISQLGCLDILVSPDILNNETSADISVVEGEDTTLLCRATGRPEPRITWKREDGDSIHLKSALQGGLSSWAASYNGSELNLYRIDRKQMGTYLCIASNDVHPAVSKRVTLSVNFLPNVQALNQLLGAPLGTNVTLECNVEAHPNPVNYWCKNPNIMLLEGLKYVIEERREGYKVSMRLTIKGFNENDVGSYSCISSNSLGKVEGVSRLYKITDVNRHGLVRESHHISILAGLSNAARGSGSKCMINIHCISKSLKNIYFLNILFISVLNFILKR